MRPGPTFSETAPDSRHRVAAGRWRRASEVFSDGAKSATAFPSRTEATLLPPPDKHQAYVDLHRCLRAKGSSQGKVKAMGQNTPSTSASTLMNHSSQGAKERTVGRRIASSRKSNLPRRHPYAPLRMDWTNWQPRERANLCFIAKDDRVLLIRKKRGLGAGKINGPGGKIEPGETALASAIRETQEEIGVTPLEIEERGTLHFQFVDGYSLHCAVFLARNLEGEPIETEEATPYWFDIAERSPLEEMCGPTIGTEAAPNAGRGPFHGVVRVRRTGCSAMKCAGTGRERRLRCATRGKSRNFPRTPLRACVWVGGHRHFGLARAPAEPLDR